MQIHYKEKALLANQYKLERAEKSKNWIGRNKWKVALFGLFMSIIGPVYRHEPDGLHRKKSVSAAEISDLDYMGTAILFGVFYALVMFIAYWVWKYQDEKSIKDLKKQRSVLLVELDLLEKKL